MGFVATIEKTDFFVWSPILLAFDVVLFSAASRNFPDAEVWHAAKRHGDLSLDFRREPRR
jgi:hypothetical protein